MDEQEYYDKEPYEVNIDYFKDHAEEIIDTDVLMSPDSVGQIKYGGGEWGEYFGRKRLDWNYARMEGYFDEVERSMPYKEAYKHCHFRLNKEFAEETGHYELFNWK